MATAPSPAPAPVQTPAPAPAPAEAPPPAELLPEDPTRPVLTVRILRDGPMGEFGAVRDDLPADWLAEAITRGDVEVIPA